MQLVWKKKKVKKTSGSYSKDYLFELQFDAFNSGVALVEDVDSVSDGLTGHVTRLGQGQSGLNVARRAAAPLH